MTKRERKLLEAAQRCFYLWAAGRLRPQTDEAAAALNGLWEAVKGYPDWHEVFGDGVKDFKP